MKSSDSTLNEIKMELGKIKGIAEGLKAEISREKLNRQFCRGMLVDLKLSLERIRHYLSEECESYFKRITSTNLIEALLLDWASPKVRDAVDSVLNPLVSSTDWRIYEIDNPSSYKDEDVRRNITNLVFSLDSFITTLSDKLSLPLTGMAQLQELISIMPGLNENWLVSICYLSAMEVTVNKKQKELGIKIEETEVGEKDFAARFRALLKNLESKGIKISELEKELPQAFWNIRHKVVHAGYSPTQEELDLITNWVKKIITLFLQV